MAGHAVGAAHVGDADWCMGFCLGCLRHGGDAVGVVASAMAARTGAWGFVWAVCGMVGMRLG
jgi:hypothetical protein